MDIAALSMAISSTKVAEQVNISVLKKNMEMTEETGSKIAEMISETNVVTPNKVDVKI